MRECRARPYRPEAPLGAALPSTISLKSPESDETIWYEPNPADHPHRADRWSSSRMALQYRLGLLSEWRFGAGSPHRPNPRFTRAGVATRKRRGTPNRLGAAHAPSNSRPRSNIRGADNAISSQCGSSRLPRRCSIRLKQVITPKR